MIGLFIYLLNASLLLVLVLALYQLLLRNNTFHLVNRFYLLAGVLISLIVPLLPTVNNSSLLSFLLLTYAIGVAAMLLRLLIGIVKVLRSWTQMKREKYVSAILLHSDKDIPAYSFFNRIVIPSQLETDFIKYNMILSHEQIHVQQKHSWDSMFLELVKSFLWFNPFVYILKNELSKQHEFFVDRKLTEKTGATEQYGRLLIVQSGHLLNNSFTNAYNNSFIKNRIQMMMKTNDKSSSLFRHALSIGLVLVIAFFTACQTDAPISNSQSDEVLVEAEVMPEFPGGEDALLQFVYQNIKYPAEARTDGIEGMVVVQFVITKEGEVSNIETLRDIGGGCGEAAAAVVAKMPKWNPGQHKGKAVNVEYKLPVKFKLQ